MNEILTNFGLTKNENEVYLGVFKYPLSTGSDIARKLRMDKSSVYRAIENLVKMGLLISSKGKKGTVYTAASPSTLLELYQQRKQRLDFDANILRDFINNLKQGSYEDRKTFFIIEHGVDAFKKRMTESLKCREKIIRERFGFDATLFSKDYIDFVTEYAHLRVKNKIQINQLESDVEKLKDSFKGFLEDVSNPYKEVRLMPKEFKDKNYLRIWDDTVNILSFDKNDKFIVLTIKDKYLSSMMKNFYDFVWNRSEEVKGTLV